MGANVPTGQKPSKLERDVADIGRKWVPDPRLGVFEIRVAARALVGVTSHPDALGALRSLAAAQGTAIDVTALPNAEMRGQQAIVVRALAPLVGVPAADALRTSEALHGEVLDLLERRGEWLRIRAADGYHAWVHAGYVATGPADWAEDWTGRARARAAGAELRDGDTRLRLPIGSRVALGRDGRVETADGTWWRVTSGAVRPEAEWRAEARFVAAPEWALRWYGGAPYAWGGRTEWGIDCSGLVQGTYAARGISLPRDADLQFSVGREVPLEPDGVGYEAGDVLLFAERGRVSHAALWAGAGRVVHAALARGGVASDDLFGNPALKGLRDALVGVRRVGGRL